MNPQEFIDGLKRDKARGSLAPHQIILLIALSRIYKKSGKILSDILTLNSEFQEVWNSYKNEFKTTNNKLGMPLKAFVNKGYLTIKISEDINDFRNLSELESKISTLVIEDILITLFKADKIEEYLISRISK
ncbi:hypothetical protein [Flavobacterium glaciei]|uniref:Uncharacterized protein n=1 Tax=Flavobacterium glaciei TaxID=386300 RepID=A0A562PUZ9_9FLAO|nr:hypothetical protein [Flavobacterium glaciei]RDI56283.1 hypothetical protein DFR66_105152 [Flavobacterium glaciei]TWI48193.1 hypothetical protein IQ02_01352 [Flavobacterium glaciei]